MKRWCTLAAAALVALAVVVGACGLSRRAKDAAPPATRVLRIEGGAACANVTLSGFAWIAKPVDGGTTYALARDGDLLSLDGDGKGFFLLYRETDGAALEVSIDGPRLVLGGVTASVRISEETDWSWLEEAGESDLARLRFLELDMKVGDAHLPVLEKLAAANPTLGLAFGREAGIDRVLPLFHPRALLLQDQLSSADVEIVRGRRGLEFLWFGPGKEADGPADIAFLGELPDLRRLVIEDWNPEKTGPLPKGCRGLRSLVIVSEEMKDFSAIGDCVSLRDLIVVGGKELENAKVLKGMGNLELLGLSASGKVDDTTVLGSLPKLTRLGLPGETAQDEFASLMGGLPRLRELELVKCEAITDLTPLKELPVLERLIMLTPKVDLAPLRDLKGLRYLALSAKEVFQKSPQEVEKLAAALPGCTLAAAEPFCLGSGWLVALVPAVAAFSLLARRGRAQRPRTGQRDA